LDWSERKLEIGSILGVAGEQTLCNMVIQAKNGEVKGLNEDVGAFANGISAPWHFAIRIRDRFQFRSVNSLALRDLVKILIVTKRFSYLKTP
jgi:hypothetical protein